MIKVLIVEDEIPAQITLKKLIDNREGSDIESWRPELNEQQFDIFKLGTALGICSCKL